MRNKILRIVAELTALVTVLASVATVSPALAATATSVKDTMSTLKVSATSVSHVITMTLPAGPFSGNLDITYDAGFSAFTFTSGGCAGGTVANATTAANVVHVTLTTCGAGTLTINFTGTNPGSTGSKTSSMAGTAGITGNSFAEAIVTDDQVSVTASVDPSITFNVGQQTGATVCDGTFSNNGGTVALGTITTGAVSSSDVGSVGHICTRVSTNAASGAAVSVKDVSAALVSTSTPGHTIPSATATVTAGTQGYGLCVGTGSACSTSLAAPCTGAGSTTPASATPTAVFATCTPGTNGVTGLTASAANVWTLSGASSNAFAELLLKAAISATTPAHNDYTDTLTFVATGTF